ncbi:uncharacterized protein LOC127838140 [Dreissena polymorpha]|uniref:TauD/TfdA-like domain-containing protein n=1 Tax=Dreissena polymorpha TaxID=45954 RepID=A0A9D4J320_DREPO|nr:uncharacterized protein LOC127838140 [Dreissena polymorpha]KAH3797946.1 hypothetical protein DPMN_151536 [Dreissena polymorpha]
MTEASVVPDDFCAEPISLQSPEQKIFDGKPFPLILRPLIESGPKSNEAATAWVREKREVIESLLLNHGAVLFRGFPVNSPEDFDSFVKSFSYEALPYVGGAAPRRVVTGNVFTANEAPPDQLIPFHHEMAQVPTFPSVLFFYCDNPPAEGGQTPLVISTEVYKAMRARDGMFVDALEEKGVVYNRVLPDGDDEKSPIGRGWQSTYQTTSREEAESKCKEQGTKIEWLPNGCLRTQTKVLPAVRVDARTDKKTWFNSIIAAYLGWSDVRNDRKLAVTFPDGTPMPEESMQTLNEVFEELAIDFRWEKGDVVMIDNRQVLHGRRSFTPPRRILAALCK